jgi:HlyD family type I secretion membrane fusion protein
MSQINNKLEKIGLDWLRKLRQLKPSYLIQNAHYDHKDRRLLAENIQIEEELVPAFVKPALKVVALILVSFVVWASITPMKEVARAQGEIIPSGKIKIVQHLDGGIVSSTLVEERDYVKQGQLLLQMDAKQAIAELEELTAKLSTLSLKEERLLAFIEGRKPNMNNLFKTKEPSSQVANQIKAYEQQVVTKESSLQVLDRQILQKRQRINQVRKAISAAKEGLVLASDLAEMREGLANRKLVNRSQLVEALQAQVSARGEVSKLEVELAVAQQELEEVINKRNDTSNQVQNDAFKELTDVQGEKAEVFQRLERQKSVVERLDVLAPAEGLVQNLQIYTVGQVVAPGGLLMHVVPNDATFVAEVKLDSKDVGFVRAGQPVKMRISSYDYSRFGYATGVLKRVAASSTIDEKDQKQIPYYKAWVDLDKTYVGDDPARNILQPGMSVEAEITTGEKKLIAYLLKPIADLFTKSFHER